MAWECFLSQNNKITAWGSQVTAILDAPLRDLDLFSSVPVKTKGGFPLGGKKTGVSKTSWKSRLLKGLKWSTHELLPGITYHQSWRRISILWQISWSPIHHTTANHEHTINIWVKICLLILFEWKKMLTLLRIYFTFWKGWTAGAHGCSHHSKLPKWLAVHNDMLNGWCRDDHGR